MIKGISINKGPQRKRVRMCNMEPLQVGTLLDDPDHVVMRTARKGVFEVIDLIDPRPDGCWDKHCTLQVDLLAPGESVRIELFNE